MKPIRLLLLSLTLLLSAQAEEDTKQVAFEMMESMGLDQVMADMLESMLDQQMQAQPTMRPFKNIFRDFLTKYLSYDNIKDPMAELYADSFTAEEMRAIAAFYRTPAGAKSLKLAPKLMQEGAALGERLMMENIGELQANIAAESARLEAAAEVEESPAESE